MANKKFTDVTTTATAAETDTLLLATNLAGTPDNKVIALSDLRTAVLDLLETPLDTELTIASGAIQISSSYHTVDTEADAASDDLTDITGFADGRRLVLRPHEASKTVVVKHNTGNIKTKSEADVTLDSQYLTIQLIYDVSLGQWIEI